MSQCICALQLLRVEDVSMAPEEEVKVETLLDSKDAPDIQAVMDRVIAMEIPQKRTT